MPKGQISRAPWPFPLSPSPHLYLFDVLVFLEDAVHLELLSPDSVVGVLLLREESEHVLVLLSVGGGEGRPCTVHGLGGVYISCVNEVCMCLLCTKYVHQYMQTPPPLPLSLILLPPNLTSRYHFQTMQW